MLVNNKFAFYHIPRTGGSSVESILWHHDKLESPAWKRMGPVHAPLCDQPIIVKDYNIYTNIRNPFDRLVSLYALIQYGGVHDIDVPEDLEFEEFIRDHWGVGLDGHDEYHTQEEHLFVRGKFPENVTLVKTEEINQRWPEILRDQLGVKGIKMPHVNAVSHGPAERYYSKDLINYVKEKESWVLQFYENPI